MQNRKVCILCNLKPANMRGIKSEAMVLAASNSDHTTVEPPEGAQVGERVTFPGFVGEPDEILNPKKKVWETLQVDLHTKKKGAVIYLDQFPEALEIQTGSENHWRYLALDFANKEVILDDDTELVACYKDIPLTTSAGVCTVSSIAGGSIK